MRLLAWKGDFVVDGTNARMRRAIEVDYETERRQKRLRDKQRIDAGLALIWITVCFLCVTVLVTAVNWAGQLVHYVQGLIR